MYVCLILGCDPELSRDRVYSRGIRQKLAITYSNQNDIKNGIKIQIYGKPLSYLKYIDELISASFCIIPPR